MSFHAVAAEIHLDTDKLKNGDCHFYLNGMIEKGDNLKLLKAVIELPSEMTCHYILHLNSKGGDVYEALSMHRRISGPFNFITVVQDNSECSSSCVFLLAAGNSRFPWGKIGIHRPYTLNVTNQIESKKVFDELEYKVSELFKEQGISIELWHRMIAVPPESVYWLSDSEKLAYGVKGENPSYADSRDSILAQKYQISKMEYLRRKSLIDTECRYGKVKIENIGNCIDQVYKHGTYN